MTNDDMKEQGNYVWLANSVINSNRWIKIEEKLETSEKNKFLTTRQRKVIWELLCVLRTEYDCIKHDYYENKYTSRSLLAWRTRNILEINTWCRFCCEDIKNAEDFFKWAAEDMLELENQLEKWGKATNQPSEWFEKIDRTRKNIYKQAKRNGITNLEAKYKSPSNVAKIFGHDKTFQIHNKILSKFAHPTPMLILARELDDEMPKKAFYFFSHGCLFFYDAFSRLEDFINENNT